MAINQQKIEELVGLFRQQYPNWISFSDPIDPDFQKDEIDYKQRLVAKATSQLAKPTLHQLTNARDHDGLISRIQNVGQDKNNNLLFLRFPSSSDLNILKHPNLDKQEFGVGFYDLLYGDGESSDRLKSYLDVVEHYKLPNKWTFPTFFLFLCHPDTDIFVKPMVIRTFLSFIGEVNQFTSIPSAEGYEVIKQVAHELKDGLHAYAPRDMVDIQSFIWTCTLALNKQPRYWKFSPDNDVWQWDEFQKKNFIAIEWDELGDISGLSRKEFDTQRDDLMAHHPEWEWKKNRVNQVWVFSHIQEGDRIVINKGTNEVLGIGTVTGSYYFAATVEQQKHRLPVEWDDLTPRSVNEVGWQRTLIALTQEQFDKICGTVPIPSLSGHLFTSTTFDLLAALHTNPKKTVYMGLKSEFRRCLEEPFQKLFRQIAARLPEAIKDKMEIDRKLFARIPKNDFNHGGAWAFYWGAFYRKGGKRIEDAQLFMWMNHERLEVGFFIGLYGSKQLQQFLNNCQVHYVRLLPLLEESLSNKKLWFGSRGSSTNIPWQEWLQAPGKEDIHVSFNLLKQEVLKYSTEQLINQITQVYEQLFPLILLAIEEDPLPALSEYLDPNTPGDDEDLVPLNDVYSLAQCAEDTNLEEVLLNDWIQAIARKRQSVLYGPSGTGKTFLARHLAKHLVGGGSGFIDIVQFHPAYTYEDFIQGIRPKRIDGGLDYPVVPGRFLEFCKKAQLCGDYPCVLIIDELNRANLSQVFGELMYLMEYRDEKVYLASGESFSIPNNVYIIGTMNTADRSIALVDHALRRRFAFLYLKPNYEGLKKFHQSTGYSVDHLIITLKQMNAQIGDRHYEIGTSFFLRTDLETQLRNIWQLEIEPYLEEFFFDQPDKITSFRWETVRSQLDS
jgi:5-methylcytosine-specific restriction protein B